MTERLRKILKGGKLAPKTADEAAVKIAVDNAGGGGESYETVAEIAVGMMTEQGGMYAYQIPADDRPAITDQDFASGNLYVNGHNLIRNGEMLLFNIDPQTMATISEPAIGFAIDGDEGNLAIIAVIASPSVSNTTVKILKKVSGGSSTGLPEVTSEDNGKVLGVVNGAWDKMEAAKEPLVVEFTATESGGVISISTTTKVTEILAAKSAGRDVVGTVDLGAYKQEFPLTAFGPGLNNEGLVGFGAVVPDSGDQKASMFAAKGDVVVDGGTKTDRWQLFIG